MERIRDIKEKDKYLNYITICEINNSHKTENRGEQEVLALSEELFTEKYTASRKCT